MLQSFKLSILCYKLICLLLLYHMNLPYIIVLTGMHFVLDSCSGEAEVSHNSSVSMPPTEKLII